MRHGGVGSAFLLDADQHVALGPGLGQWPHHQAQRPAQHAGTFERQDAHAEPHLHHAAHRLEAAHLHAELQRAALEHGLRGQQPHHRGARFERHQVVTEHVGKLQVGRAGQRMAGLHHDGDTVGAVRTDLQAFHVEPLHHNADVGFSGPQ